MIILRQKEFGLVSWYKKKFIEGPRNEWENKQAKNDSKKDNIESLLPATEYKKLKELDSEISKIWPGLGDGDEYANFHLPNEYTDLSNPVIPVITSPQGRISFSYDTERKTWIDNNQGGKKVSFQQVKQGILKDYKSDEEDWKKNRYWEDNENEQVLNYLRNSQKLIQSKL